MAAPAKAPKFFDVTDPDGPGLFAYRAVTWLIDRIAEVTRSASVWTMGGREVPLAIVAHQQGRSLVLVAGGATISLVPEAAGWLEIRAETDGVEVFCAYLEQPHENYALWPADAPGDGEAPGRVGKRLDWLDLKTDAWPTLAGLGANGVIGAKRVEK